MNTGDKWNWAMIFAAIGLAAASLGEVAMASSKKLPHGYAFQAFVGIQFSLGAFGVCLVVACAYAAFTKRTTCLVGFAIAIGSFPFLFLLTAEASLRFILPLAFLVGASVWRPRQQFPRDSQFDALGE